MVVELSLSDPDGFLEVVIGKGRCNSIVKTY